MATTKNVITVMAVDDHPVYREGISAIIGTQADLKLVAEASSGTEAVSLYRQHRPDITIMDVQMADMDGIEATARICREFCDARIIVLTTYDGDAQAVRALRSGAWGYLLKNAVRKDLIESIRMVAGGKRRILAEVAIQIAEHAADEKLSPREMEILKSAAQGNSNRRISAICGVSEETVKSHIGSILSKLRARDRTHAVAIALKRRIIEI